MIILIFLIFLYSIIYLTVFVLAHQDANMIKPLTAMTAGMLILLAVTCIAGFLLGFWYISIIILFVILGLLQFFIYLMKY